MKRAGSPTLRSACRGRGTSTEFDVESYLYSKLNGNLLRSKTNFKATFNVTKHMNLLVKKDVVPDKDVYGNR